MTNAPAHWNPSQFAVGQKVMYGEFEATVIRHYHEGMWEIRLPGGGACVSGASLRTLGPTYPIRTVNCAPGVRPQEREPIVGRWYAGMTLDLENDFEEAGELMRYEGEDNWLAEDEDPDSREPNPSDYDYLQEQH